MTRLSPSSRCKSSLAGQSVHLVLSERQDAHCRGSANVFALSRGPRLRSRSREHRPALPLGARCAPKSRRGAPSRFAHLLSITPYLTQRSPHSSQAKKRMQVIQAAIEYTTYDPSSSSMLYAVSHRALNPPAAVVSPATHLPAPLRPRAPCPCVAVCRSHSGWATHQPLAVLHSAFLLVPSAVASYSLRARACPALHWPPHWPRSWLCHHLPPVRSSSSPLPPCPHLHLHLHLHLRPPPGSSSSSR